MLIYVLNGLNGITDAIETFESVIWNVQFFGPNDFELKLPGTDKNINDLSIGTYLVREDDVTASGYKNVMMVRERTIDFDNEKGWILTLTGSGLKTIVGQRVVWKQTNLTGSVEAGLRSVITNNIISPTDNTRKINDFILDTKAGYTDTFEVQLLGENIEEWIESVCQTYGIGWDVFINNGKYVFTTKKGADRTYNQSVNIPVVFSPEYDNLATSEYKENKSEYKNAALIGGEGEGVDQRYSTIGTASGLNRYETYIDGSGVSSNGEIITEAQYYVLLQNYGKEQLSNYNANNKDISGTVLPNGMYNLNVDYFLGDLVQIINKGISAVTRITEIIYSEDATGLQIVPTFSEWED